MAEGGMTAGGEQTFEGAGFKSSPQSPVRGIYKDNRKIAVLVTINRMLL
jgi:hypothetical protein